MMKRQDRRHVVHAETAHCFLRGLGGHGVFPAPQRPADDAPLPHEHDAGRQGQHEAHQGDDGLGRYVHVPVVVARA